MTDLPVFDKLPVEPVFKQEKCNGPIEIGMTKLGFESTGKQYEEMSTVKLRLLPKPRLEFTCPQDNLPTLIAFELAFRTTDVTKFALTERGVSFDGHFSGAGAQYGGIVFCPRQSGITATKPTNDIAKTRFHLFNFPSTIGPDDFLLKHGDDSSIATGPYRRIILKADGWTITIVELHDADTSMKALRAEGGYALTHAGEIERADGSAFSSDDLEQILTCLHHFLSFAMGRWNGAALPVGFASDGQRVFEQWGLPIIADGSWNGSCSWFDQQHSELLSQVFPGFVALFSKALWRRPLTDSLYWYLGASDRRVGIGVDTGLILAQTALEGLAWNYCVQDRKMVSASAFAERGGLNAANKLRLLAASMGIPTAIPSSLTALGFRKGKKWEDAMEAITTIRNALVHADADRPVSSETYYEAWLYSLWFIDLVILRLCGHNGKYANRMARRYAGKLESVPWA